MRSGLASLCLFSVSMAGCFYDDPINERPSAEIIRHDPELPNRGDEIRVSASIYDPDDDGFESLWAMYACSGLVCDDDATETGTEYDFAFDAPAQTLSGAPTTRVHVDLDVTDSWGAVALPRQSLDVDVGNALPTLELQRQGRQFLGSFPVELPVTIIARKADFDDGAAAVYIDDGTPEAEVDVHLYAPTGAVRADATLTRVEETATEITWELRASKRGQWDLEITAHDPLGDEITGMISVPVEDDQSPCISVAEPGFPPEGARVVVDEPRRFALLSVDDDLDLFPYPDPDDEFLGRATFAWFLASPATGGAMTPLAGFDGSSVDIDPALYAPGDQLELRVEISDRVGRPLCDAALASCEAVDSCFQRRTWALEVR